MWLPLESVFRLLYPYWFLVSACSISYRERPDRSACRHWVCMFIPALPSGFALYVWSYVVSDTVFKLSYLPLVEVLSLWSDLSLPRFSAFVWNSSPDSATFGDCVSCVPFCSFIFNFSVSLCLKMCLVSSIWLQFFKLKFDSLFKIFKSDKNFFNRSVYLVYFNCNYWYLGV